LPKESLRIQAGEAALDKAGRSKNWTLAILPVGTAL